MPCTFYLVWGGGHKSRILSIEVSLLTLLQRSIMIISCYSKFSSGNPGDNDVINQGIFNRYACHFALAIQQIESSQVVFLVM